MSDGKRRVVAIGFFDGVHLGHGALMRATVQEAKRLDAEACVMSFDRHPGAAITGRPGADDQFQSGPGVDYEALLRH